MSEALMQRYYQTYNSEDAEALSAFYHPEVELHSAEGVMRGREQVLATYRYLVGLFEDRMHPTRVVMEGNTAVVDITDELTARDSIEDFIGASLAAGETLTLLLRGRYRIENGQFRHIMIEALA
ncbi:nuclear transport factor 2 family protein [Parahaliea aestuarii]|uniref:Nuclear transport factor 2 family protein n=1 Tax=Parahaliea aestuarii TaxID=1852021 RepID=A0A5C8ZTA5_9GAMM|nr:nuclear transport factor 2 family protein [Parahaliea aestuarii]TXS91738.1 nuclear transport factor 2 family protein [Parahaliea aestuarii]